MGGGGGSCGATQEAWIQQLSGGVMMAHVIPLSLSLFLSYHRSIQEHAEMNIEQRIDEVSLIKNFS